MHNVLLLFPTILNDLFHFALARINLHLLCQDHVYSLVPANVARAKLVSTFEAKIVFSPILELVGGDLLECGTGI